MKKEKNPIKSAPQGAHVSLQSLKEYNSVVYGKKSLKLAFNQFIGILFMESLMIVMHGLKSKKLSSNTTLQNTFFQGLNVRNQTCRCGETRFEESK